MVVAEVDLEVFAIVLEGPFGLARAAVAQRKRVGILLKLVSNSWTYC